MCSVVCCACAFVDVGKQRQAGRAAGDLGVVALVLSLANLLYGLEYMTAVSWGISVLLAGFVLCEKQAQRTGKQRK